MDALLQYHVIDGALKNNWYNQGPFFEKDRAGQDKRKSTEIPSKAVLTHCKNDKSKQT